MYRIYGVRSREKSENRMIYDKRQKRASLSEDFTEPNNPLTSLWVGRDLSEFKEQNRYRTEQESPHTLSGSEDHREIARTRTTRTHTFHMRAHCAGGSIQSGV